jgi:catechol 2,3-dioxygenase-like lactoylglutathione lyase family enzyme
MIKTFGLTHITLKVKDVKRSSAFYHKVFGTHEMYHSEGFIQIQTPGAHDIIVFEQGEKINTQSNGVAHFGFRLVRPDNLEDIVKVVETAGGTIINQGEFEPGEPYVFLKDPDGYEVEIWYEKLSPAHIAFN